MNDDERLVKQLYDALERRDGAAMAALYHPEARFSDGVFPDLRGPEVGAMWRMLCGRATDLKLRVRDITCSGGFGSCWWEATYTFGRTGRKVVNTATARFAFRDGAIVQHKDEWSFRKWSGQALGPAGKVLGWTKPFQAKVQDNARAELAAYMAKHGLQPPHA